MPPPGHLPFGPSLSAPLACWFSRRLSAVHLCEPWHPTLAPDRRRAGSRARPLTSRAPPCGEAYFVPRASDRQVTLAACRGRVLMAEHQVMSLISQVITATRTTSCRNPHRPVRAQCTHTVPQAKPLLPVMQSTWGSGDTSGEHGVSLVCRTHWKPCSTSPSLSWVPWASVPHRPQYSATRRLPSGLLGVLRFVARSPIPCVLLAVCGVPAGLVLWSKRPEHARAFGHPVPQSGMCVKETDGSPKFPSSPYEDMPRSQTPVVSCALAITHPGLLPSSALDTVGFPTTYIFRGSITRPTFSLHPAPYGPLQGGTRVRY